MNAIMRPAPKVMVVGDSGGGKTFTAAKLAKHGINVRFLFIEPGMETLHQPEFEPYLGKNLHYHYVKSFNPDFKTLIDISNKVNTMTNEVIAQQEQIGRKDTREFIDILKALENYKSDLTGEEFGSVDTWDNNTCIVIDSLSALNKAAMNLIVGMKPTKGQNQWGAAMDLEEKIIDKLTLGCNCWVILLAHLERETNEITGAQVVYPAALGRKVGPKLGRNFNEVFEAVQKDKEYIWRTQAPGYALKRRALPLSDKLPVDWTPIVKNFVESDKR